MCAMHDSELWPDVCGFLLAFTGSGLPIGLYTLVSMQPVP